MGKNINIFSSGAAELGPKFSDFTNKILPKMNFQKIYKVCAPLIQNCSAAPTFPT